ncbi:fumarylacetoacetate hydrolase family protein [Rhodocyclus tenuis]|uniref:fumarylacetoacetate hydrolase family protein n=1 Tax=Rhodocyclus tenuis TaxID=1066 RepID=UPI001905FB22|nr:fumarylacetoacetate hydrolase family protein [Rhodocyclus tenuis]MBK1680177.1 fumarylacetoacetate hydrolase [Rhodocyclus tenuis]
MTYLFPPAPQVAIPVVGSDALFPVRRVYCVGRNYAEHAAEMGADRREPPFFFSKPADALVPGGGEVPYPPATANLQHEVELVVALQRGGADIAAADAADCVFGYAVGIDLTRRDLQTRAKEKNHPWDMGKGFDYSAPVSALRPVALSGHPVAGAIGLQVNGQIRQSGDLVQMTWPVAEVISHLSRLVRLAPGDLIFTGTPAGVSTVVRGDLIECAVAGVGELSITLR